MERKSTTSFTHLKVGERFTFVRKQPHPLGWPDGPWEKTGERSVRHVLNGCEGEVDSTAMRVQVIDRQPWTAGRVRDELPAVRVKATTSEVIHQGRVSGRRNEFATVVWDGDRSAEWAWETIAQALNDGRPLLY